MLEFITGFVMGERTATRSATLARDAAGAAVSSHLGRVGAVDERVDRLLLVVEAMWTLLRDQGLSDEELRARIEELDRADGVADERRTSLPRDCPGCSAKVAPGLGACQYCGAKLPAEGPFSGL